MCEGFLSVLKMVCWRMCAWVFFWEVGAWHSLYSQRSPQDEESRTESDGDACEKKVNILNLIERVILIVGSKRSIY